MKPARWIRVEEKLPEHCTFVLVKAPGYAVAEAVYVAREVPGGAAAGFHLTLGGGQTILADHVKWWVPAPLLPA